MVEVLSIGGLRPISPRLSPPSQATTKGAPWRAGPPPAAHTPSKGRVRASTTLRGSPIYSSFRRRPDERRHTPHRIAPLTIP